MMPITIQDLCAMHKALSYSEQPSPRTIAALEKIEETIIAYVEGMTTHTATPLKMPPRNPDDDIPF